MGCGASNSSAPVAFKSKVSPEPTFAAVEQRRKSRVVSSFISQITKQNHES